MAGTADVTGAWRDYWLAHAQELGAAAPQYLCSALLRALRPGPGQSILEAGSGTGGLAREVSASGAKVTALDVLPQCAAAARGAGLAAVVGDLFRLPFADAAFDAVYNSGVMEHFADDKLVLGIAELARVLRPGGLLVCIVPSAKGRFYRWGKRRLEAAGRWEYGVEIPQTSLHEPMTRAGLVDGAESLAGVRWQVRFLDGWRRLLARVLVAPFSEQSHVGAALFGGYLLVSAWRKPKGIALGA